LYPIKALGEYKKINRMSIYFSGNRRRIAWSSE